MTYDTPAEKSAALADSAIRFAKRISEVAREPDPIARMMQASGAIAAAEHERMQIMAAPCCPVRPSFRTGGAGVQVLRCDS